MLVAWLLDFNTMQPNYFMPLTNFETKLECETTLKNVVKTHERSFAYNLKVVAFCVPLTGK
jgi:hypothetical protein